MKHFLRIFLGLLFLSINSAVLAQDMQPIQVQKQAKPSEGNSKAKQRAIAFTNEITKVLNLSKSEQDAVMAISIDAANRVEAEKSKKQSKELTEQAIRKIRNEKVLALEKTLGKERMGAWRKHQKAKRTARTSETELLED
jgi:hypothetical protein